MSNPNPFGESGGGGQRGIGRRSEPQIPRHHHPIPLDFAGHPPRVPKVYEAATIRVRGAHRGVHLGAFTCTEYVRHLKDLKPRGISGRPCELLTNHFKLKKVPTWCLFQYTVTFQPPVGNIVVRKKIVRSMRATLGAYIFDGTLLFRQAKLPEDETVTNVTDKKDESFTTVTIKYVGRINDDHDMYIKFYNMIIRKCLYGMGLEEVGRHFFDRNAAIVINQHRLQLWPGYITTMRHHEKDILLSVEVTHKVLRSDNVLSIINRMSEDKNFEKVVEMELRGAIVMTLYNRKMYRVEDVGWGYQPVSTFTKSDATGAIQHISFVDYYKERYKLDISEMSQPLLVAYDSRRNPKGGSELVLLVPEFCQMTGLSDDMRSNFTLMRDLAQHLQQVPTVKLNAIQNFMTRLKSVPAITDELKMWDVDFETELTKCTGRILPREQVIFADNCLEAASNKAEWSMAFRSKKLLGTVDLNYWAILVPSKDVGAMDNLVRTMIKVATPLNFIIRQPIEIVTLADTKITTYLRAIDGVEATGKPIQMMLVILPNNKLDLYTVVKKRLSVDMGIPSQCMLAKNASSKSLMSIATNMTVQMCAKLGGEPWTIKIPLHNVMVVGFDVYRGGRGGVNIGALVATTSQTLASYHSVTSVHKTGEELAANLVTGIDKCLQVYHNTNKNFPDRIFMYRDGVDDGQLEVVSEMEMENVKARIESIYRANNRGIPKFSFTVVTRRTNTRFFDVTAKRVENPPPGTVVDDVVTKCSKYDFFLIAQTARQGTASPTYYNVLHDEQMLGPDRMQLLTHKLCHIYFNWAGTVAVPAPCQYARKLAFLTGTSLGREANKLLHNQLHFL